MKKVLFSLALAALMLPLSAQNITTFPYDEGFEAGIPENYTFIDADGDGNNWFLMDFTGSATNRAHSGMACISSASYDNNTGALTPDNWMILPGFEIPTDATDFNLTWWVRGQDPSWAAENYSVYISTTGNTVADFTTAAYDDVATGAYIKRSVSLASYVGQTIYIAFRHYNVTDMFQLNIDDIHVGGPQAPFVSIEGPTTGMAGDALTFTATSSEENSTYAWTIDGTVVNTTGATMTQTFTAAGTYEIAVTATANGLTSDATSMTVTIISCDPITEFPWVEDFEEGIDDCYTLIDNDGDGYNWDPASGIKAHSGTVCVSSASWVQSLGALYPDNWLVTPAITLPADASNFTLSWWVIGQDASYAEEPYSVYIANGKTVAEFTATTSVFDGVSTSEYEQQSVSLANYAGQTIYIAFRHYDITDMFRINLDDIRVGAGTAGIENAEEANVAIFPNPVRDMLTIEGNNVKSVEVIDMDGRVVLTNDRAGKLDMSELSDGVYMVRVMSENGVSTKKIVKK